MKILFESSHLKQGFDGQRLDVVIKKETAPGQTATDQIYFEVPKDFHVHNDGVATALMTLSGSKYDTVEFNFGISQHCAETLQRYFKLKRIGPVDKSLERRPPGKNLGLNFRGGFDSLAVYLLLEGDVKLISSDFGGSFGREASFFNTFSPHVSCKTDLRQKGYGPNHWAFVGAASILFADYLDLGQIAFGSALEATLGNFRRDVERTASEEMSLFSAVGIGEVCVVRGLTEFGTAMVVMQSAPHLLEPSLTSLTSPSSEKYLRKKLILRILYERAHEELPKFLELDKFPKVPVPFGDNLGADFLSVFFVRRFGVDFCSRMVSGLEQLGWTFVHDLSLDFFFKYNPHFIHLMPGSRRNDILNGFHRHGIYPYSERDWVEFDRVRSFLTAARSRLAASRLVS